MQQEARKDDHDVTTPHRDNHYLLMVATHGSFKLNLDFEELAITAPAMLMIFPGQVHHIVEISQPEGWAISFDSSLIDNEFQAVLEKGLNGPVLLDTQGAFLKQAVTIMAMIEQLQLDTPNVYTGRTTHALLAGLLNLIAGKITTAALGSKIKETRGAIIEQAFGRLLKQHYKAWKQPARYAEELAISVAHLNDTVKGITGVAVSVHIQQQSILEAKRLLYFTSLSVKEIGYQLGYDEPVYFGKLFKKVTGVTPLQFRQQFRD